MKCPKCNGVGVIDNPKYHTVHDMFWGIEAIIKCRKCKGLGYIVTDMNEIVQELKDISAQLRNRNDYGCRKRIENIINILTKT